MYNPTNKQYSVISCNLATLFQSKFSFTCDSVSVIDQGPVITVIDQGPAITMYRGALSFERKSTFCAFDILL
jgi:hypothetical protein